MNYNSLRSLFPKYKVEVKEPNTNEATKQSILRRNLIIEVLKGKSMYVSDIAIKMKSKPEQVRYDVKSMINAKQLINLSVSNRKYFVKAA